MLNRVSWGATLAGVAVALVVQLIVNMIGIGIGAATLDPGTGDNPSASSFSIGAALWWTVSGILAALAGGLYCRAPRGEAERVHRGLAWPDDLGIHNRISRTVERGRGGRLDGRRRCPDSGRGCALRSWR